MRVEQLDLLACRSNILDNLRMGGGVDLLGRLRACAFRLADRTLWPWCLSSAWAR